jgi:hypothetical protein
MRIPRLVLTFSVMLLASAMWAEGDAPPKGFTSLFNGKDLAGWTIENSGQFSAEDGVLKLNRGGGWLRSDREYDDFILRLEVRWLEDRQDSGIFLRAGKEGQNWPDRKYEVQCENSERIVHIFGAKCDRDPQEALDLLKPTGHWNSLEIRCEGTRCEVLLNGKPASSATELSVDKGYLGIQGESGVLEFRNLFIKPLQRGDKE